jgi:branched-chain amino acid transport system permease protein
VTLARARTVGAFAVAGAALVVLPFLVTDYFLTAVAIKALWLGIAAASLIFLAAYGGMVSLAQTALYGIAAYTVADLVAEHGWNAWLAIAAALAVTALTGLVFGLVASRSTGIYFLMITFSFAVIVFYFFQQVPEFGGHEGINDVSLPAVFGDAFEHREQLYFAALVAAATVYVTIRYLVRTPFGLALQGVRDDATRMRAVGFNVNLHRTIAFGFAALVAGIAGIFAVDYESRISPGSIDLTRTIDVLTIAVIGGLYRLEGAWIGAAIFVAAENYTRGITERFETWIGALFLLIVLLSPGGVAGVVDGVARRVGRAGRGRWKPRVEDPPAAERA